MDTVNSASRILKSKVLTTNVSTPKKEKLMNQMEALRRIEEIKKRVGAQQDSTRAYLFNAKNASEVVEYTK